MVNKRKSPVKHTVKKHTRNGRTIQAYDRGRGQPKSKSTRSKRSILRQRKEPFERMTPEQLNKKIYGDLTMWVAECGGIGGRGVQSESDLTREGSDVWSLAEAFRGVSLHELSESDIKKIAEYTGHDVKYVRRGYRGRRR